MESINIFSGGLFKDNSPLFQPKNTYNDAHNIRIIGDELGSSIAISNIKGNILQQTIPDIEAQYKFKFKVLEGNTDITINGETFTFDSTGKTYQDLYDFIIANYTLYNTQYKVYYNDSNLVLVPIQGFSITTSLNVSTFIFDPNPPYIPAQANLEIIGYGLIRDSIYLFTTNSHDTDPKNNGGSFGQIWKFTYNNINFNPANSTLTLIYNGALNFSTYWNIPQTGVVGRYENSSIQRLYWTDNYNKLRSINVVDPQLAALDQTLLDIVPAVDFDIPIMQDIGGSGTSGPVAIGVYQAAYRLKNTSGATTTFSELSNMVFVVPKNEAIYTNGNFFADYVGASFPDTTNKHITWRIDNLDLDFERIEIAILKRVKVTDVPTIFLLPDEIITGDSFTFTWDGTQDTTSITLEEFLAFSGTFTTCKTIGSKDNRLLAGNIKNTLTEITDSSGLPFDTRAFRAFTSNAVSTDIKLTNAGPNTSYTLAAAIALDETENTINDYATPANACFYKPNNAGDILGGEGLNISYEFYTTAIIAETSGTDFNIPDDQPNPWRHTNPDFFVDALNLNVNSATNSGGEQLQEYPTMFPDKINAGFKTPPTNSLYRGYQRGEIYRFGIQFFDKSKNPYFVKWIGDIKMPDFQDNNTNAYFEDHTVVPVTADVNGDFAYPGATSSGGKDFRLSFTYVKAGNPATYRECFVQALGINFTINNLDTISDQISGYSIVRVEREEEDKTIVSQGYMTQIEFYLNKYYANSPLAGGALNTFSIGVNEDEIGFFITPDFCDPTMVSPDSSMSLEIKATLQIPPRNTDTDMKFGAGDPFFYWKLYNWKFDYTPGPFNLDQVTLVSAGGETTALNNGFVVGNYDLDFNTLNLTISSAVGNQAYFFKVDSGITSLNGTTNKYLVNITRVLPNQYGGNTYTDRSRNTYISDNHFRPLKENLVITETFEVYGGDTFVNMYDSMRMAKNYGQTGRGTYTTTRDGVVIYFPVESKVNSDLRHGLYANKDLLADYTGTNWNQIETYFYNPIYSAENDIRIFYPKPDPFIITGEFDNRFYISEIKINGELVDSWGLFKPNNYWDVEGIYGPINSCLPLMDKMYFWQDRAFGIMEINPRAVITDNSSTLLQIGTGLPLQRHDYLSTSIGTKHQSSTIRSAYSLYWFDINTKKFYQYNSGAPTPLSDVKGLYSYFSKSLHGNIQNIDKPTYHSQSEGINGIMATFDYKRQEAIFTFHDNESPYDPETQTSFTISFSEKLQAFISLYDFTPRIYINDNRYIFSNHNEGTHFDEGLGEIWMHDIGAYCNFYGTTFEETLRIIVNDNQQYTKIFDNIVWDSQALEYDNITESDIYINYNDDTFQTIRIFNDYQNTNFQILIPNDNIKRKERSWQLVVPRNRVLYSTSDSPNIFVDLSAGNKQFGERMRDKYIVIDLKYDNLTNRELVLNNLRTQYRLSSR